ncbi:MAG: ADP-forming succinate--CoA ligase subunit beta [Chloroflexi bacterium]|nr:ADP-forming succinate--CoA ligase subunit beta [Chloroflexota bacterium]
MKIHEYQAKAILAQYGVPVPQGRLAQTPAEARAIAEELGRVVIKAQVHAGGRGKAGGIKVASTPDEAEQIARQMLGSRLVTHQTGPEGVPVHSVLVEQTAEIAKELYLGVVIDSAAALSVIMASEAGGMEIEEVAAESPEKILRAYIDPISGYQPFQGNRLGYGMGLDTPLVRAFGALAGNLFRAFESKDCSLAEINPLVITTDGKLLALDAKLNFDDNGLFRQRDVQTLRDVSQEDALEVQAQQNGINNYIKLTGSVGCVVNGAGLAMATLDAIKLYGGDAANFLDIGTVNNVERVVGAFRQLTADPDVKAIYFNIFGGMARVDVIALGIVESYKTLNVSVPVVARLTGNAVDEGRRILAEAGIRLIEASDTADGAKKAVDAARAAE